MLRDRENHVIISIAPAVARRSLCAVAAMLVALSGCKSPPPPSPPPPPPKPLPLPPTVVHTTLSADTEVNPDSRGRASPIVVRVLELKTLATFGGADFFSLWDREKETLGEDLVAREEFQLRPGDQKKLERIAPPETRHVGVIAAYRDLERAKWRGVYTIVAHQTQSITIVVDARNVSIASAK